MKYVGCFWSNFYFHTVQHGIQGMHVVSKMSQKMKKAEGFSKISFDKWAGKDFTVRLMNGGDHEALYQFTKYLEMYAPDDVCWDYFYESQGAANNTMTSVGIILPEYYVDKDYPVMAKEDDFETDIIRKIRESRLAQ